MMNANVCSSNIMEAHEKKSFKTSSFASGKKEEMYYTQKLHFRAEEALISERKG